MSWFTSLVCCHIFTKSLNGRFSKINKKHLVILKKEIEKGTHFEVFVPPVAFGAGGSSAPRELMSLLIK
jgi:hypothetical protein